MQYKEKVEQIHQDLHSRTNDQKDFVGWLNLPTNYDKEEIKANNTKIPIKQNNEERPSHIFDFLRIH